MELCELFILREFLFSNIKVVIRSFGGHILPGRVGDQKNYKVVHIVVIIKTVSGSSWDLPKIELLLDGHSRGPSLA